MWGPLDTGDTRDVAVVAAPGARLPRPANAFVASSRGFFVVDWSLAQEPVVVAGPLPTGDSRGVFAFGDHAYVAALTGLHVVDISSPWAPSVEASLLVSDWSDVEDSRGLFVSDDHAFVATCGIRGARLYTADVSSPSRPEPSTSRDIDCARAVAVSGGVAHVATDGGLRLVDATPRGDAGVDPEVRTGASNGVFLAGDVLYVASREGLYMVDVTLPISPELIVGPLPTGDSQGVHVTERRAYVASTDGLYVVDLGCDP